MKLFSLLITAFALAALPVHAAKPFFEIIDGDADLVLAVHDVTALRTSWPQHPLAQKLDDPELLRFFSGFLGLADDSGEGSGPMTTVLRDEFNLTWQELAELFPGQVAAALYNLPDLLLGGDKRPDLAILAEFSESEERLNELLQIQFERNAQAQKEVNPLIEHELVEENFMGETLYFDEVFDGEKTYTEDGYALVEGIFVLATPKERLRSMVESIKAGTENPLTATRGYRRLRDERAAGDLTFYANFEAIVPPLNAALRDPEKTGALAMIGASGASLEAALALPALLGFGFDLELTADGVASHTGLMFREKAGLLRLLTYDGAGLPSASYVPENVFSTSVTSFDFSEMLIELEVLMTSASPSIGPLFEIQLQNMKSQTGVDLRSAVLDNFGPEVVTLSVLPQGGPRSGNVPQQEQLFVIEVQDAASLSAALEAMKDQVPGLRPQIEVREFQGQTIHRFQAPQNPGLTGPASQEVSYAITRSHLLVNVGRIALLQEVLAAMEGGRDGFWQLAEVDDLFDGIRRPDTVARSYFDLSQAVGPAFESLATFMEMAGSNKGRKVELPKGFDFPYALISDMNETDGAFFSRSRLVLKEGND